ncbi:LLM class flavin-dependent oxidoreductase [Kineosporia sp. NBRC 101731]|uniref:LLM class flavin-dependent oxidoreductase n=1 Tax=Kineosporia sp. NBRC 101731 TaxID=3032199 RepID=UPI0024A24BD3|nr:LLM class flavin-dependent oxidoreductase [Kineosporia sp. NBRC 101731]GLY31883.1 luciferase-like protein [Kineosporia sp. NBRC 101731]
MTNESMRFGFILPGGSATEQLRQAVLAEQAGWDGVFVWEAAYGVDAWGLLSAMAASTSRIRLGTMLTPLPWRRPWKLASQVATLDDLSGGRAVVGLGLGALDPVLPTGGGEVTDRRQRAAMLDEGIDLMRELWRGGQSYTGEHYQFDVGTGGIGSGGLRPVQPSIPIWAVGAWPRPRSMARILRCDGVIPEYYRGDGQEAAPDDQRELIAWLAERGRTDLDVVHEGETPADDRAAAIAKVTPWAAAGATWWLESRWGGEQHSEQKMREVTTRLEAGPPRA